MYGFCTGHWKLYQIDNQPKSSKNDWEQLTSEQKTNVVAIQASRSGYYCVLIKWLIVHCFSFAG